MKPHAFVAAMPFGKKDAPDGKIIDFEQVYSQYIKPALIAAGVDVIRAAQEQRADEIRTDMFQELSVDRKNFLESQSMGVSADSLMFWETVKISLSEVRGMKLQIAVSRSEALRER